jgi:hypothetical protein
LALLALLASPAFYLVISRPIRDFPVCQAQVLEQVIEWEVSLHGLRARPAKPHLSVLACGLVA